MRAIDRIKSILPVSSRSYHAGERMLMGAVQEVRERQDVQGVQNDEIKSMLAQLLNQQSSRKAIYLVGEPGYPNFGDELIAAEWLRYLSDTCPDVVVYLDCARPGPAAAILRGLHPNLRTVDTIHRLATELPIEEFCDASCQAEAVGRAIHAALDNEGRAARYVSGLNVLRSEICQLHYLGGGYMNGMWQHNLARLAVGEWLASRGTPVLATGLGLYPLKDALDYVRRAIVNYRFVGVRDEETLAELNGLANVHLMPDDCFVNALEGCYSLEENLPDIMVCIQSDLVEDVALLHEHVIRILEKWRGVGSCPEIGIVECNPYIDYPILETLQKAGYRCRLFPAIYLIEFGFPARKGQTWLTTRYHPHILAAAKGCSGSFIPLGNEFYRSKHEAVLRMGSRWTASEIGSDIPVAGEGFGDDAVLKKYSGLIRSCTGEWYGR